MNPIKKQIHVVGAVIIKDERILCAKRGNTKTLAYLWEFPGGKIELGETPEVALVREIKEEMLCDIKVGEKVEYTIYDYDFGVVHLTTFKCKIKESMPTLTEHVEVKWLKPSELGTLEWAPADIPAVQQLMKGR